MEDQPAISRQCSPALQPRRAHFILAATHPWQVIDLIGAVCLTI